MAVERYGMRCLVCSECIYIGKTMGNGIYSKTDGHIDTIHAWMWKHLNECLGTFEFGISNKVLFEVIHEGHEDVYNSKKHWNRFKLVNNKLVE